MAALGIAASVVGLAIQGRQLRQWRKLRTRIRNLTKLGVPQLRAIHLGLSSKGPYRLAKTFAVHQAFDNVYLARQELVSDRDLWVKSHYPNR